MYIGFGHRLRGLGGMRVGFRVSSSSGIAFLCIYGCLNACIYLCWYSMLAMLWMMYGMGYLFFYLPTKGIMGLIKKKRASHDHSAQGAPDPDQKS